MRLCKVSSALNLDGKVDSDFFTKRNFFKKNEFSIPAKKMMLERVIAVVLALIVCVAAIEGGAITKKRSAEEYGEGFENGLARVSIQLGLLLARWSHIYL